MPHNNDTYILYATDATSLSEIETEGYPKGKTSTDGNLIIVNNHNNNEPIQTIVPIKPSYVLEDMVNFPYLNHQETLIIIRYMATTVGASDGFSVTKTTPIS